MHEGEKNRDGPIHSWRVGYIRVEEESERRGNRRRQRRRLPTGADILCTPVKWPMQIERHRRTVGVHVTVNEPISTSFLLFNAFSEWTSSPSSRRRTPDQFRFPKERRGPAEFYTFSSN